MAGLVLSSGSGSVGRASPCQGEGRGFESRLPLHSLISCRCERLPSRERVSAPSSSGRTADFESVWRGSNPRGAASLIRQFAGFPSRRNRPEGGSVRGDVPKWLRGRSAKPLFSGSIPLVASTSPLVKLRGISEHPPHGSLGALTFWHAGVAEWQTQRT